MAELGKEFYVDADKIHQALSACRSFNLIHLATSYKFDIFPLGAGPDQQVQHQRTVRKAISLSGNESLDLPLESAEDTLLSKLYVLVGMGHDLEAHSSLPRPA